MTLSVRVAAAAAHAFSVATEGASSWWPLGTHSIGDQPAEAVIFEPYADGRWFERSASGSESDWGRVLSWEPPSRLVLAWHLNAAWRFDPEPANASRVELRFVEHTPGHTVIELEHTGLERHPVDSNAISDALHAPPGWCFVLDSLARAASDAGR